MTPGICHSVWMTVWYAGWDFVTPGICHSVWMTVWYAGWDEIPSCIPDCHPHRVTNTRRRIVTVISPDDGHIDARNM